MAFDVNKVNWTPEELTAAEALDKIYEGLSNGVDPTDIALLMEVLPLWDFLKTATTKLEYADKIVALGTILFRDNF